MKIFKAFIVFFMSFSLLTMSFPSFSSIGEDDMTLQEFIDSNKKITVQYEYPSVKLASKDCVVSLVDSLRLEEGTPVIIRNLQHISSNEFKSGDEVSFVVVNDVKVNGKTLIKSGTPVNANITFAKKRGRIGAPGIITISNFSAQAVDGSVVPLKARIYASGEDKSETSLILGVVVCLPFLLMRGGNAEMPIGMTRTAFTSNDVDVNFVK